MGDALRAGRTLAEAAELLAVSDPVDACLSLTEAVGSSLFTGDVARALSLGERAIALADADHPEERLLASIPRGASLVIAGQPEQARPFLQAAAAAARAAPPDTDPRLLTWAALAGWWVGDDELMISKGGAAVAWARDHGALAALPWAAVVSGVGLFRTGRWVEARAVLEDGVEAGRATAQHGHLAMALAPLAWLDACQGRTQDCLARVDEGLALTDRLGLRWLSNWLLRAHVLLELGGTPSGGTLRLRRSLLSGPLREPPATSGWPDLVEALVRRGDVVTAKELLATYTREVDVLVDTGSAAIAARLAGVVGDDPRFEEALALHAAAPAPFEEARTHLTFGEALRRAGQRVAARGQLHRALEGFDALGAAPWIARAEVELRATGERLRRGPTPAAEPLTSQELQIALLVARGGTNREVGAQLYLSPKTVEWHLGRVYAKVGVRSRTELARTMAGS